MFPAAHHSCLCGKGIGPVNKRSDIDMMVLNGGGMKEQNIFTAITVPASEQVTRPGGPALWQKSFRPLALWTAKQFWIAG